MVASRSQVRLSLASALFGCLLLACEQGPGASGPPPPPPPPRNGPPGGGASVFAVPRGQGSTRANAVPGKPAAAKKPAMPHAPAAQAYVPPVERPDIVLILIDTLRADHLDLYGHDRPTSPALRAFARTATDYRRAYAQSSWTAPSVTSLMTSRYPREVGVRQHPRKLAPTTRTLAQVLREHGYHTEGVSTNLFISERYGHELGFDRFRERHLSQGSVATSPEVTDLGLSAVREAPTGEPLFVYLHYFDPHLDYVLREGFELGAERHGALPDDEAIRWTTKLHSILTEWDMVRARQYYDSEIAFTDHHVGRLLTGLRALDRFEDAVIVIVADHGEEFLDHGHLGHTVTLYDELIRVPLLIKAPRQTRGRRVSTPVALLDVAPTILALAGLPEEPSHRGVSLVDPEVAPIRPIFASTFRPTEKVAIVQDRHKAILDYNAHTLEVFDLLADPHEQHPLPDLDSPLAALLRWRLEVWNEGEFAQPEMAPVQLSAQEKALMRALGYGQ